MELASVIIAGVALVVSIVVGVREIFLSRRIAEIEQARRSDEVEAASKAQLEPSVVYDGEALFFRVENYGGGAATDIRLRANGPTDWTYESTMLPAVMPPGARWYGTAHGFSLQSLAASGAAGRIIATVSWEDGFSAKHGRASQERVCDPVPRY